MNKNQVIAAIKKYSDALSFRGIKPQRHLELEVNESNIDATAGELHEHARWMCDEIIVLASQYDEDWAEDIQKGMKIMRWLAFVQGVLWSTGFYSIEQMKDDNR